MAQYMQPCDWIEHDVDFKYVVDVFGRTNEGDVSRLRLTGFKPYVYLKVANGQTKSDVIQLITTGSGKNLRGLEITQELKLDAMKGFQGLEPTKVWKISSPALWMFKTVVKTLKNTRGIDPEDIYESNLPPLLRMFHERDIQPASPFEFEADECDVEDLNVDKCYMTDYECITPFNNITIPIYVCAYDLEVYSDSGQFPVSSNPKDEIIQIGVSFRWSDALLQSVARYVFVSGTCAPSQDPNVTFVSCINERDLLTKFHKCIETENPDVLSGYNTFGFDDPYIADRAQLLKLDLQFGRMPSNQWGGRQEYVKTERKTFELASGKFAVRYIDMPGRLAIDLYLSMRREQNLDSYKLDNVSSVFLRDKVVKTERIGTQTRIYTKSTRGLFNGNLVRLDVVTNTNNPYKKGKRFQVTHLESKYFDIDEIIDLHPDELNKLEWSFAKDDVSAKQMFESHRGKPEDRALIAKYCVQDCDLVLTLLAKLDTIVNARGMADVCRVPIQYIFLRGQGIKIYSAVVYNASKRNQIIMTQGEFEGDSSYEGAIVLPPKIGMYLDQPIPVLDFNSLYPSNMIAYNLSPDTLAYVKNYDMNGRLKNPEAVKKFDGYKIDEISYDIKNDEGETIGRQVCGFVQPTANHQTLGLLPLTLDILLKKRKETRKKMETIDDDAQKSVLNGLQLAYKVVANSVYGQCGSKTSPIRRLEVAASTTAVGRQKIYDAKKIVEEQFGGQVIYGDTDSIFIKFKTKDLQESMDLAKKAAEVITASGRKAHKIEYEKTFFPFVLFCRKRYMGMMYEDDVTKCKRKSMGIAIKRRDNAPIVKDVFGGALDILMEHRDIRKAQRFVQEMLVKIIKNEMPLDKYIVTKQLRDDYITEVPSEIRSHIVNNDKHVSGLCCVCPCLNPKECDCKKKKPFEKASFVVIKNYALKHGLGIPKSSIAHRTLADRMEKRDEGSAPQVGDRLAYIYVAERRDNKKQGDKIEQIDYVREHNLKPDTEFYITNQIQNPLAQMFALALEDLEGYVKKRDYDKELKELIADGGDEEDSMLSILKLKEKELDRLIFMGAPYLTKHKRGPMDMFVRRG